MSEHLSENNMSFDEDSIYLRRFYLLINCCDHPLVIIDENGRIKEFNIIFQQIVAQSEVLHDLRGQSIFKYLDDATSNEIKKVLRHRSMVGNFRFDGSLIIGERKVDYKFRVSYYCDESGTIRELMIILEPVSGINNIGPEPFIRYLGEVLLPYVTLTSQIIGANKKVIYSVNWDDLPPLLKQEFKADKRICCSLFRKSGRTSECICDKVLREGRTYIEEVCIENGSDQIWVALAVMPIMSEDKSVYGLLVTLDNISEQRKLAKSVEEYIEVIQKNLVDCQLVPTLIRRLREPISYILSGVNFLLEEGNTTNPLILARIKKKCEECREIFNQIGGFLGEFSEAFIKVEVDALVRSMVLPVFSESDDKKVVFRFSASPVYISCVPYQFAQALIAIIDNSLRYASKEVLVSLVPEGKELIITVEDDGKGVPEEIRKQIFTPFFTPERESGRIGLGLSLAKTVIESLGGHISVGQSKSGGANFTIRLPALEVVSIGEVRKEGGSFNILVIEDDEDLADLLKSSLQKEGYNVYVSRDCEKAKEIITTTPISFIILDLLFPEGPTGLSFYEEITQKERFSEDRILVITGDSLSPFTKIFLKSIKSPYLEKPFDLDSIKSLIARVVERE